MDNIITFTQECAFAYQQALKKAAPFVPSQQQLLVAHIPLVHRLLAMPPGQAHTYITDTFKHEGTMPMAIRMYKEKRAENMVFTYAEAKRVDLMLQAMFATGAVGEVMLLGTTKKFRLQAGRRVDTWDTGHRAMQTTYANTLAFQQAYGLGAI